MQCHRGERNVQDSSEMEEEEEEEEEEITIIAQANAT